MGTENGLFEYISGPSFIKRWGVDYVEMKQLYKKFNNYLTAYYDSELEKNQNKDWQSTLRIVTPYNEKEFKMAIFKISEIEKLEREHPEIINTPLTKRESQELGLLKKNNQNGMILWQQLLKLEFG